MATGRAEKAMGAAALALVRRTALLGQGDGATALARLDAWTELLGREGWRTAKGRKELGEERERRYRSENVRRVWLCSSIITSTPDLCVTGTHLSSSSFFAAMAFSSTPSMSFVAADYEVVALSDYAIEDATAVELIDSLPFVHGGTRRLSSRSLQGSMRCCCAPGEIDSRDDPMIFISSCNVTLVGMRIKCL
ncbi:hypothetical protein PIB30_066755 [Stylosanthes scabra]|uniref:Uncharacterized protein n=1 Tax=Stylosanthes scabra TaxID=79078 RepID=A0ABU6WME3_9FABA|nr:hypothetical protein [Stylosanthes scabra]